MAQIIRPQCRHCNGDTFMRGARGANGVVRYAWYCLACQRWAVFGGQWISHASLTLRLAQQGARPEDIPIVQDDSAVAPCVICGDPGEAHHWAPQHLKEAFGDEWYKWPTANLCRPHHDLWHHILTPNMSHKLP
jgi:hypothetical protein